MPTYVQTGCNGSSRFLLICGKDMEFLVLLYSSTGSIRKYSMPPFCPYRTCCFCSIDFIDSSVLGIIYILLMQPPETGGKFHELD